MPPLDRRHRLAAARRRITRTRVAALATALVAGCATTGADDHLQILCQNPLQVPPRVADPRAPGCMPQSHSRASQTMRDQGSAVVVFVVDAQGKLLSHDLLKSSGSTSLDGTLLAAIPHCRFLPGRNETGEAALGAGILEFHWELAERPLSADEARLQLETRKLHCGQHQRA